MTMLYAAWHKIALERRRDFALADLADGREWTFGELEKAGETREAAAPVICPTGSSAEFILDVLCAWRTGKLVCPLDQGQTVPDLPPMPAEWVHLKTTSGTAGTPQMTAFTASQLAADGQNIVSTMGLREDWPNLGLISLSHSYGFSNLVLPLLLHGIPLVLLPSRLPEALRQACVKFPQVTLAGVPALWRVWNDADGISPAIKLAISAGAPLPVALETSVFERTGIKIRNFYGASECGGICYDASETPRTSDEDVGEPLNNVSMETDCDGCLIVTGSAVGETYWPSPMPALARGRFLTGDRAELLNGRVFLRGRRADLINLAGRKVSPELIEQAVRRHPGVRDCVVFGVPESGARGENAAACVSCNGQTSQESLKRFVEKLLPAWQVPRHWWFVPEIEESERGKISRAKWRERFLAKF